MNVSIATTALPDTTRAAANEFDYRIPHEYFRVVTFVTSAYILFLTALSISLLVLARQLRGLVLKINPPPNVQFRIHKSAIKKAPNPPKPDTELEDGSDDDCRT